MAKGYGRGMPGMGGGMNMNMIKQAQKMQQDMMRMQQELQEKEYQAVTFCHNNNSFTDSNWADV